MGRNMKSMDQTLGLNHRKGRRITDTNKQNKIILILFTIIMIVTGISDSLRGGFSPVFAEHFQINATKVSLIISVSYVGNLFFLFFGGKFVDSYSKKKVLTAITLLWMFALLIYIMTDSYFFLVFGMFFSMGASTLLSTTINVLIPFIFLTPGLVINVLNFTQGLGVSGCQKFLSPIANGYSAWKYINLGLLLVGIICLILTQCIKFPQEQAKVKPSVKKSVMGYKVFPYLVFVFGFYFIAEHGLMNWLVSYGSKHLGYSVSKSATYLSVFFALITVGRLLFAPFVNKIGALKSLLIFSSIGGVLYIFGILTGMKGLWLVSLSGIGFSILYPTLVLMIRHYYEEDLIGSATGKVISIATFFDIGFNLIFGKAVDLVGYSIAILILPVSMACFCGMLFVTIHKNHPIR